MAFGALEDDDALSAGPGPKSEPKSSSTVPPCVPPTATVGPSCAALEFPAPSQGPADSTATPVSWGAAYDISPIPTPIWSATVTVTSRLAPAPGTRVHSATESFRRAHACSATAPLAYSGCVATTVNREERRAGVTPKLEPTTRTVTAPSPPCVGNVPLPTTEATTGAA